jgi:tRNA A-37 threonylcarbamoyl transferase component Bud32
MYETVRRQVKLFPPLALDLSDVFKGKMEKQNTAFIMKGYHKALKELAKENYITYSNGYVQIVKSFAEETIQQRNRFSRVITSIRKGLLPHIRSLSLRIRTGFGQNQILLNRRSKKQEKELRKELDETEKFLLMPSPLGLIPFSEKTTIQDFVKKTVPGGDTLDLEIEKMGGVLNSVFLLRLQKNHGTQKIVVKKYEDWQGFKWFPLALWTLGTKSFAVLGKTRLKREYSNNQFLRDHGFAVPKILYVSVKERLIFEEYVEGEKLTEIIKQLITSPQENAVIVGEIIKTIGKEMARVHSLGVTLGDCKPENILVTESKDICFLDLEQSTRSGSRSWDIAEFLYYSGHYILPIHSDLAARTIASSLIEGYIQGKGKRECVREAASTKYTKIFSVFTLPHIIMIMANICKKAGKDESP